MHASMGSLYESEEKRDPVFLNIGIEKCAKPSAKGIFLTKRIKQSLDMFQSAHPLENKNDLPPVM